MKITKVAKKKRLDTGALADELGSDYYSAREKATTATKHQHELAAKIKATAEEVGEVEGDRCIITGSQFVVGVLTTRPTQEVDWESFRKMHPGIWKRLVRLQVDEKLVEAALQQGVLPRKLLSKFLRVIKPPQKRVIVERVGETNEAPDEVN